MMQAIVRQCHEYLFRLNKVTGCIKKKMGPSLTFTIAVALLLALVCPLETGLVSGGYSVVAWGEGEDDPMWNRPTPEKKLVKIGTRLLQANHIEQKISFIIKKQLNTVPNAYADTGYAIVTVEKELLDYIDSDDELAAILGHEIAHVVKHHGRNGAVMGGVMGGLVAGLSVLAGVPISPSGGVILGQSARALTAPVNQLAEIEADRLGTNYIATAGYNPLAMESIIQKIAGDGWVMWRTHPGGTTRLKQIHQHIAQTYPQWLTTTSSLTNSKSTEVKPVSPPPINPTVPQPVVFSDAVNKPVGLPHAIFNPSLEAPTVPILGKP
jgi:Zn-dependent protease with chaperone function